MRLRLDRTGSLRLGARRACLRFDVLSAFAADGYALLSMTLYSCVRAQVF